MAIYTERIIRVNNNKASMDKDIYIYRGNRNIEIQFTIVDHQFKFKDINMVNQLSPSHAYVTLLNPQMIQIGTGKAEVVEGVIKLVITSAMIDEKTECGEYSIVVDLYDEEGDSLLTIPPVENQLHVLDRMTEIDDIPDELRFVYNEQTGDLNVTNIDVTYDENAEIKTIEGISLADIKTRKLVGELSNQVDECVNTVLPMGDTLNQTAESVRRIDGIVTELSDNGYSQIKADMNQTQIQNVLDNGGLILFREGVYNVENLVISSATKILAETEVVVNGILNMNEISNVNIDGNLSVAGIVVNDCMDIFINDLYVKNAANDGVLITGGDSVVIRNLVTEQCSGAGCRIVNGDSATNVVIENHCDFQSNSALNISMSPTSPILGRVYIGKSYYVGSSSAGACIAIENNTNAPKVILDKPVIDLKNAKESAISLIKTAANDSKLGNIDILEPQFIGDGAVDAYILINSSSLEEIKIIKPVCNDVDSKIVKVNGDASSCNNVCIELNYKGEVYDDISLIDDFRNMYIMPSDVTDNVAVDLSGAPVDYVCEFFNKSSMYSFLIGDAIIDNRNDILELKCNDYVKIKHLGGNEWVILDENFKNKIVSVDPSDGYLNIPNARYVIANIEEDTVFTLPDVVASFSEIHLFVTVGPGVTIVYPEGVRWTQEDPYLDNEHIYEFIFTKVNNVWLIGCVEYV